MRSRINDAGSHYINEVSLSALTRLQYVSNFPFGRIGLLNKLTNLPSIGFDFAALSKILGS
jgi:hypothetical protein